MDCTFSAPPLTAATEGLTCTSPMSGSCQVGMQQCPVTTENRGLFKSVEEHVQQLEPQLSAEREQEQ